MRRILPGKPRCAVEPLEGAWRVWFPRDASCIHLPGARRPVQGRSVADVKGLGADLVPGAGCLTLCSRGQTGLVGHGPGGYDAPIPPTPSLRKEAAKHIHSYKATGYLEWHDGENQ